MLIVECAACGAANTFDQPYALHAGFSNVGFLYDDSGTRTLVWSSYDPAYVAIVGNVHPWVLSREQKTQLENALRPAPGGGAWRFANPARCGRCGVEIKGSIERDIYYLKYSESLNLEDGHRFRDVLRPTA